MIKQYLADIITMTRIVGSIALLSMKNFSYEFFITYTYCGISDALDGFVARKTKTESKLGSKLDSVSDLVFYSVLLFKIWPALHRVLPDICFNVIWTIFGIRMACYLFVFVRDKKLASEHFTLNKVTGFMIFLVPYLLEVKYFLIYVIVLLIVATIAALYEFKFHLLNVDQ